jgi:ABC-2 type transport system ATP-binding protein
MENVISVTSLKKSFKDNHVLKDVSFNIRKGSIFALLGSNGAGKTTAVRILSTLAKPDGGVANVCGYDVVRQADSVRERISLTGQYAAVDEALTGRENLQLIGSLRQLRSVGAKTDELLAAFKLEDAANRRASTYSGGMRRRLDIAMSLMGDPEVIFLDEPTSGLDPQSRIATWNMVKGLAGGGATVFLTTQYLEEAEYLADHIAILHEGVISAEGTADELKTVLPRGGMRLDFHDAEDAAMALTVLADYRAAMGDGENGGGVSGGGGGGGNGGNGGFIGNVVNSIEVATDGSPEQFADVLTRLNGAGVPIARFIQKLPTLEDVFLDLVEKKEDARI